MRGIRRKEKRKEENYQAYSPILKREKMHSAFNQPWTEAI